MKPNEEMWKVVQNHLGYSDEEMKIFRADPRNEDAISKTVPMLNRTIVVEVIESHGCDSGHKAGDQPPDQAGAVRFRRFGCPDVEVRCGGWGHAVIEVRMEDRKKNCINDS
jgi:hypothetical protein